ncbi:MAG: SHOCT domain-containing protein [Thermoproteota archaeon]
MSYLWVGKPYLKKTVIKFLITFAIVSLLLLLVHWLPTLLWVALSLAAFIIYYFNKRAYAYYITDKSVRIEKSWVFGGYVRELTLDQIRDVHVMQGMLARAMNCGSIVFVTTSGFEVGHVGAAVGRGVIVGGVTPKLVAWRGGRFWDIREPHRVREILIGEISEWREVFQQQKMATSLERIAERKPPTGTLVDELERLKRLLDEGAITKEEYEKAKRKLLN